MVTRILFFLAGVALGYTITAGEYKTLQKQYDRLGAEYAAHVLKEKKQVCP